MRYTKIRALVVLMLLALGLPAELQAQKVQNLSNNDGSSCCAQIVTAASNVYVVWEDNEVANLQLDIFLARSTNGGKSFLQRVNLSNNAGDSVNPRVVVAGTNVYIVWTDYAAGLGDVFFLGSTDGGATFEPVQNLTNTFTPSLFPQVVLAGSNVYVAWEDDIEGGGDVFFARSTNTGAAFEAAQNLSSNADFSENVQLKAVAGNVYVVWDDFTDFDTTFGDVLFRRSGDSGATFSPVVNLSSTPEGFSERPRLTTDGTNVYVLWQDDTSGNVDIYLRRSMDGGATFDPARNLSVKKADVAGTSQEAQVAALGKKVAVVWEDDTLGSFDVLPSTSKDGGKKFGKPTNLTKKKGKTKDAERPGLVIQPGKKAGTAGKTFIVWEQDLQNSENRDIFFVGK